jgi:hypothetical protein
MLWLSGMGRLRKIRWEGTVSMDIAMGGVERHDMRYKVKYMVSAVWS